MRFLRLMVRPLRHYADFEVQSSLAEFWAFCLLCVILSIPVAIGDALKSSSFAIHEPFSFIVGIILWFPNWALGVRRLHSRNLSGLWMFTFIGFAFLALLTNQLVGHLAWGRYVTSLWTLIAAMNGFVVAVIIAALPARDAAQLHGGEPLARRAAG
jgi:uncharacterized membrane protein YhaH (DUF805 family)